MFKSRIGLESEFDDKREALQMSAQKQETRLLSVHIRAILAPVLRWVSCSCRLVLPGKRARSPPPSAR